MAEEEEMSRATPPLMDLRLRDRQLSRGWAERILSPYLCVRVDSDEAILQGGVTTLNECGVLPSFFLLLLLFFSLLRHS